MTPEDLVSSYLADVSNEPDPARRRAAIERLFQETIRCADQDGVVEGRENFVRRIDALAAMMAADARFVLRGPVQHVDDAVLFHWQLGAPGEVPSLAGTDMALVRDGRIFRLYAVLD